MQISRKHFPKILPDNDEVYIEHLTGIIDSIDELSTLQITKLPSSYSFRLAPSVPKYNEMLLKEILKFHNMFGIYLDLSKSIKTSNTLSFNIILN